MEETKKPCDCAEKGETGCFGCKIGKIAGYFVMMIAIAAIGYGVIWAYQKYAKKDSK